jgi:hypothetical protein
LNMSESFEFGEISENLFEHLRPLRLVALVLLSVFTLGGILIALSFAGFTVPYIGPANLPPLAFVVGVLIAIVISGMFYANAASVPPVGGMLDENGVHLLFRTGKYRTYPWATFRLTLTEWNPVGGTSAPSNWRGPFGYRCAVGGIWPPYLPISREMFDAVAAETRRRNLKLTTRTMRARGALKTTYRLTATA